MAEKELRRMNRSELIEIIYALQQNEKVLRAEHEEALSLLEEKRIRIDEAGSIAEAALSLNHIFEDAQNAAQQYLQSLKEEEAETETRIQEAKDQAEEIRLAAEAKLQEADLKLEEAGLKLEEADLKLQEAERKREEAEELERKAAEKYQDTETECSQMIVKVKQEVEDYRANLMAEADQMILECQEFINAAVGACG